jgi:hypothetical protein
MHAITTMVWAKYQIHCTYDIHLYMLLYYRALQKSPCKSLSLRNQVH